VDASGHRNLRFKWLFSPVSDDATDDAAEDAAAENPYDVDYQRCPGSDEDTDRPRFRMRRLM